MSYSVLDTHETVRSALLQGDFETAQKRLDALCERYRLHCLGDHEAAWLLGVFVLRDTDAYPNPQPLQILELARSWERFDRAFEPASLEIRQRFFVTVDAFLSSAGLTRAIGDDHLWIFETEAGPVVLSHTADDWPEFAPDLSKTTDLPETTDGSETIAVLFREHLRRGPRPRESPPA